VAGGADEALHGEAPGVAGGDFAGLAVFLFPIPVPLAAYLQV
jgi:hypothetical protein